MEADRISSIGKIIRQRMQDPQDLFLVVSIEEQALFICRQETVLERYDASTSRFGNGCRENSLKTPLGIHRICEKYGAGAPPGRVFRDREDTGEDWDHRENGDNLILTRILRLEGLEPGVNQGPGIDSYERYIYIHGTGREDLVGTPLSHGCVCMRNQDIIRLFEQAPQGTLVYIDPPPLLVNGVPCRSVHFAGIFGSGMSALAQYLRFQGIGVTGSDRFDRSEDTASVRMALEGLGCILAPQNGSGVTTECDAVVTSTAVEESNPDMVAARNRGIPLFHRSDLLAAIIGTRKTIAVAGTSGKSTVTAMIFEFLTVCEKSPSLISGAGLRRLEQQGMIGNAWSGGSDLLVVEADESDGTLVKYKPEASVLLNVSKDHKTVAEVAGFLGTLAANSAWTASNADDPVLAALPADVRFGRGGAASWQPDHEELLSDSVKLERNGILYHLPLPGVHNLENLRAALCVCEQYGCTGPALAEAVAHYEGVARRFAITRTGAGIIVVDDFAHNPVKIVAAVKAARGLAEHIIAVYQPHGFGPTRFLKDDYVEAFRGVFQEGDSLYLLPIYYAGGTAQKDISSEDIIVGMGQVAVSAQAVRDRDELVERVKADARPGDCILVMGARDPSLPAMVKKIVELFGGEKQEAQ